jgi:glycosyltransferase involved in cell wall biosynthesis
MKIGIMLRHYDQHEGGVKVYTRKLLPLLFTLGSQHHYVLIYQSAKLLGTYKQYANVTEVAVRIPGTVTWDQLAAPWIAWRHGLDLIFNPKFTVPLFTRAKTMFVLHGSEWFVIPEHFLRYDQLYFNIAVPMYCRSAAGFIAVSSAVKHDVVKHIGVKPDKVFAIDNGFDPTLFRQITDPAVKQGIRTRYKLPEHYILWAGQIESRKNVARLLRAFARIKDEFPHQLVLAGELRWSSSAELKVVEELGLADRLTLPGWIDHTDLPALYAAADLFAFPSLYEGFGIPLLEAMACGCPIVTANTCAPPDVTAGAAQLVDPLDVDAIANAMRTVLRDPELRARMIARGIQRARDFSWEKNAREVLAAFEAVAGTSTAAVHSA